MPQPGLAVIMSMARPSRTSKWRISQSASTNRPDTDPNSVGASRLDANPNNRGTYPNGGRRPTLVHHSRRPGSHRLDSRRPANHSRTNRSRRSMGPAAPRLAQGPRWQHPAPTTPTVPR